MSLGTILLIILVLCLIGAFRPAAQRPLGLLPERRPRLVLVIVIILVVLGRI
ncbi:MAG: DUF3309 family protein [Rhodospirillales bacterium]